MNKKFYAKLSSKVGLLATTLCMGVFVATSVSAHAESTLPRSAADLQQQTIDVKVTVIEEDGGIPVIGAVISLVGDNSKAAMSDVNGVATLKGVSTNGTISVSFMGFGTQTVPIEGRTSIEISMTPDALGIEDVVVIGFGTAKKVNLSGAVSSVGGKVLESRPISNIGQGLQGVIPNLNINTGSGIPGQGSTYNVRGTTSTSGGSPLILVDGVQMDPNLINPQDVANVSVLKDAASAAIYGARGAYGVILITTKTGRKDQKPMISANVNLGLHQPASLPHTAGSVDYANYMNLVARNSGWSGDYFDAEYMAQIMKYQANPTPENAVFIHSQTSDRTKYDYAGETDWYTDIMEKVALNQQYNISLTGGSQNTQYFMSMGLIRDKGLLKSYPDTYTRWNTNINVKSQVTPWLEVSGRTVYNHSINNLPNTNFKNWSTGLYGGDLRPLMPLYHPDGHYSGQGNWTHPMAVAELGGSQQSKVNDIWLTGAIKATPIEGMNIVADYTFNAYGQDVLDKTTEFLEYRAVPGTEQIYPWTKPSYIRNTNYQDYYTAFNAYIDYEKQIGKHYLKAMVGYNQENKAYRGYGVQRTDLITPGTDYIGLATGTITNPNNRSTAWGVAGIVYRLNYNFDERYFIELNGRYDASSKFPVGNREGFFPSGSVAWRLSQEAFMESTRSWLTEFKIRGSYGSLGNQAISGNFTYTPLLGMNGNYDYLIGGSKPVAISAAGLVSNSFSWETVTQLDLGVDMSFFGGRLNAGFDWYDRQTKGMMAPPRPYPAQLGVTAPSVNSADLSTKGWEVSIKWADRTAGGFSYSVGFIMSDYRSKITRYDNPNGSLAKLGDGNYYVGYEMGEVWGYTTVGKFKDQADIDAHAKQNELYGGTWYAGDIKFADLDKSGSINNGNNTLDNHGDLSIIGNTTPHYSYGLTFNAEYFGFDLDLFFQGVAQRDYFPGGDQFWGLSNEWGVPLTWQMGNYWTPDNTDAYLPRQSFDNGNRQTQTGYKMNGAYLRLKQLTLGYTLPKSATDKIKIQKLRFYFSGQNLFTITSLPSQYDPETLSIGSYPVQRIYSFGLNLTF